MLLTRSQPLRGKTNASGYGKIKMSTLTRHMTEIAVECSYSVAASALAQASFAE